MSIKPKYKEMKTKIIYTIVFLMIAKLAYSQEEQYSADKFVAKCPNEIFIGAILEANSINQDTYKFLKISMNPINMGYTIPIKSQTITPSYNNMMKAIHEALKTYIEDNIYIGLGRFCLFSIFIKIQIKLA